jgi:hypothetical protein
VHWLAGKDNLWVVGLRASAKHPIRLATSP